LIRSLQDKASWQLSNYCRETVLLWKCEYMDLFW